MKKNLFLLLFTLTVGSAAAQDDPQRQDPPQRIVVSRYTENREEIPATEMNELKPLRPWRFAVHVGYTHRVAKIDKEYDRYTRDFLRKMRSGWIAAGEIQYFWNNGFGIGGQFMGKFYSHSDSGLKGNIDIIYIGPSAAFRQKNRKSEDTWVFDYSLGYLSYKEKFGDLKYDKAALGLTFGVGYDIHLSGYTFLGFRLGLSGGAVNSGMRDNDNKKIMINTTSLDLTVGLRF